MAAFFKGSERNPVSLKRRVTKVFLFLLLVILSALFIEHWRGERALRAWKKEMTREILDPKKLWPEAVPSDRAFSIQLAAAVERLPKRVTKFAGGLSGLSHDDLGRPIRGSKQERPPFSYQQQNVSTWQELETASKEAQPVLEAIRKLMKNPPRAVEIDIRKRLDLDFFPSFSHVRRSSMALHAVVIMALHRGELDAALENLDALEGCVGLYADDPSLINYMLRVAIIGMCNDACWDALQEDRWTEPQLARLQKACASNRLFPQMPNVLAGERSARVRAMDWFASHSYQAWIDRYKDLHISFGSKSPELDTANWNGMFRKYLFHPTWGYAWRAQDELDYLHYSQQELVIVREAIARESWSYLKERETALRLNYRRPPADWRFYRSLPLHEIMGEIAGAGRVDRPQCPYPDFSRAWFVTVKNLTQHELVNTVIALKRYRLREGKMPKDLAALVPAYLERTPRDLVDGRPLRYRFNPDGSFALYSVGQDAQDDGGDSRPSESNGIRELDSWSGRDWVWPQAVSGLARPSA
jgi:hypothetical protein